MESHTVGRRGDRKHFYYQCRQRYNNGTRDCTNNKSIRAEEIEGLVWGFVSGLLKHPEHVRKGLEAMIEKERREGMRGNPERETKWWLERLSEVDRKRSSFQDMAAEGLISFDELRSKLAALEETRKTARRELKALSHRREKIEELERDKNVLLESYVGMVPEGLDALTLEERHRLYKMLRLQVVLGPGAPPEVSGTFGDGLLVCGSEMSSGKPFTSPQDGKDRETIECVLDIYEDGCPVARSIKNSREITSELDLSYKA